MVKRIEMLEQLSISL
jgi:uncharacterized protein YlaN (UPF0358 family)